MEPHGQAPAYYRPAGYHSKRPFGANIPHQRTNSPTGKPVVLLVPGSNAMTTVTIATLGCKVNQSESETVRAALEGRGFRVAPFGHPADVTIVNTCTVTHRADFQSRQMARRAARSSPGSLVIVTGCGAQVDPEAFTRIPGVTALLGNHEKNLIPDLLGELEQAPLPRIRVGDIQKETAFFETAPHRQHQHTRAFLKIQDGCNNRCSYCIVPRARGPSRSLAPPKVLEHARFLRDQRFKEMVLTGVHIGAYGLDLCPPAPLERLLRDLEGADTPVRIRLSSVEPDELSEALVTFLSRSSKVCPHLHLPIQSGDDEILKTMGRKYDRAFVADLVSDFHERLPDACIGADVITGFPGETDGHFQRTVELIESLPLSYLHVFPYSRRKGTPASTFFSQVAPDTIRKRAEALRVLNRKKRQIFYRRFLRRELPVLLENRRDKETGNQKGLSRNYIPVVLREPAQRPIDPTDINQEFTVRITGVADRHAIGTIMETADG